MYKFVLMELVEGGGTYNRKRNGKYRWRKGQDFYICNNCNRMLSHCPYGEEGA